MNIFGFLAAVVGCGTAIVITWLLTRKPISFRIIKTDAHTKSIKNFEPTEQQTTLLNSETKDTTPIKENENIAVASMDAVIKAANTLMGIGSVEEDTNGKE